LQLPNRKEVFNENLLITRKGGELMKKFLILLMVFTLSVVVFPELAQASVESSLRGLQSRLTHVILPVLSIMSLAWAAFSMMSGNEKGRVHFFYALIGCALAFGAGAIVDFISQAVG
jgi:hypothetical protein